MNWLAHLRLGGSDPVERLGNLAGDFVRGHDLDALAPPVRVGVELHRRIDRFVDAHPAHRRSQRRLPDAQRRVAAALVDVFYDHVLARHWPRLGDGDSLENFAAQIGQDLDAWRDDLPPLLRDTGPEFELANWLVGYREIEGIEDVLGRMQRRRNHPRLQLVPGIATLRADPEGFEADFLEMWPELVAFVTDETPRLREKFGENTT